MTLADEVMQASSPIFLVALLWSRGARHRFRSSSPVAGPQAVPRRFCFSLATGFLVFGVMIKYW